MHRQAQIELSSQSRNMSCTEPEERGSDAQSSLLAVEKPQQVMEGCTANGLWTTNFSLLIHFGVHVLDLGSSRLLVCDTEISSQNSSDLHCMLILQFPDTIQSLL